MIKKMILMFITMILLTGCEFDVDPRCDKGFSVEGEKCVKIDEQKAIHKKRMLCMNGYEINGRCYLTESTANTNRLEEVDEETGEITITCPPGYRLTENETSCEPVFNGMTEQEYFECPKGYTFSEDGIKENEDVEEDGLKNKCYKRIEKEFKKIQKNN